ncbi:MAG: zinc finger RNA-binding protein [Candidatus Dependentiae bacterium]|nr:zinc finger RNA-binding protein [Candidatus Dependentiae bacterium]
MKKLPLLALLITVSTICSELTVTTTVQTQVAPYSFYYQSTDNAGTTEYDEAITQAAQLLVTVKTTYKAQLMPQNSEAVTIDQDCTIKVATPTTKGNFYCPYCDIRFSNWPDAQHHSTTQEHKNTRYWKANPDEYVANNPEAMLKWKKKG